ncbi:MAG: hypothetical protein AAF802_18865 [Planctomycetota bacterium]
MEPSEEPSEICPQGKSSKQTRVDEPLKDEQLNSERASVSRRLRTLRLELEKTRSEAIAARLEARAKELELQIARLDRGESSSADSVAEAPKVERLDGAHSAAVYAPHYLDGATDPGKQTSANDVPDALNSDTSAAIEPEPHAISSTAVQSWSDLADVLAKGTTNPEKAANAADTSQAPPEGLGELTCDDESAEGHHQHKKPAVWIVSGALHAIFFVVLALWTISSHQPLDAVAIAGSFEAAEEMQIETLEIESESIESEPQAAEPSAITESLSDFGDIAVSEVIADVPAPTAPVVDANAFDSSMASMSMKTDSDAKMEFCGVEGGGNHFVYLVDSSGSMGDAFESARAELLRSIAALTDDQRFYVIFFDAESDYMRISDPGRDETRSVYATPDNKQRLGRWARSISMDRGRAPYDALPFALELRPDVIFLLSDGEFPQRIEDMLKEINRVNNLFGDDGPISIIHTIGYHSREGETRMKRIAEQNGGQYRYVPEPG